MESRYSAVNWSASKSPPCPVCTKRVYLAETPNQFPAPTSSSSPKSLCSAKPFRFLDLAAEIRIRIYELYIENATTCSLSEIVPLKVDPDISPSKPARHNDPLTRKITATIEGEKHAIQNIAPVPLLFTNKLIHHEFAATVYPRFELLEIIPVVDRTQHRGYRTEQPPKPPQVNFLRWPYLTIIKAVKISIPSSVVWAFCEDFNGVRESWQRSKPAVTQPGIGAIVELLESMKGLRKVDVDVDVRGESGLTLHGGSLAGKDCLNWLLPLKGIGKKRGVTVEVGFGASGRCSGLYERRWEMLMKERGEL